MRGPLRSAPKRHRTRSLCGFLLLEFSEVPTERVLMTSRSSSFMEPVSNMHIKCVSQFVETHQSSAERRRGRVTEQAASASLWAFQLARTAEG